MTLWQHILEVLDFIFGNKNDASTPVELSPDVSPPTPPQPVIQPAPPPKYLWDTPENARHSLRVIADEEGLTTDQKDKMSQTVHCESGYDVHCVMYNTKAGSVRREKYDATKYGPIFSIDAGICQWNSVYHGKEISTHDAEFNPEMAIRLMCKYVKEGLIKQWVCYSKSLYTAYSA